MPPVTIKKQKQSLVDSLLMTKLHISIGEGAIDRNILQASSRLGTPKSTLCSVSELSEGPHS